MSEQPWYQEGLRFRCTGCGNCCTGGPGFVWVNQAEIEALAHAIGETDLNRFEKKYVCKIGIRKSLKELPESNWDCVFFDNQTRQCKVYDARPRQCRSWPFWESNVRNPEAWEHTCEVCPGSGQGDLYSLETIEDQVKKIRI